MGGSGGGGGKGCGEVTQAIGGDGGSGDGVGAGGGRGRSDAWRAHRPLRVGAATLRLCRAPRIVDELAIQSNQTS